MKLETLCAILLLAQTSVLARNKRSISDPNANAGDLSASGHLSGSDDLSEVAESSFEAFSEAAGGFDSTTALGAAKINYYNRLLTLISKLEDDARELTELVGELSTQMQSLENTFQAVSGKSVEELAAQVDGSNTAQIAMLSSDELASAIDGNEESCVQVSGEVQFQFVLTKIQRVTFLSASPASVQACSNQSCVECSLEQNGSREFECGNAEADRIVISGASRICEVGATGEDSVPEQLSDQSSHLNVPQNVDLGKVVEAMPQLAAAVHEKNNAADNLVTQINDIRLKVEIISSNLGGPSVERGEVEAQHDAEVLEAIDACVAAGLPADYEQVYRTGAEYISLIYSKLVNAEDAAHKTLKLQNFLSGVLFGLQSRAGCN